MAGETIAFSKIADLVRQTVQPQDAEGMPYIGLEHIEEGSLRLKGYGQAEDVTSTKFKFSQGDILFGKLRPYFRKVIRAPFDGVCSTDIWVVRAKFGVEQGYVFYWMAAQDFVDFATQGSEGTKMPRAKWEHVSRYERARLPLDEQRAIAHILGTLDDKIELNRKMNETLEAMARAIFKSWFIDFDPVRAKAEGREPGLPKEIADLFSDDFEDSELGEIPKGWEVKALPAIIDINPPRSLRKGEEAPYVDMKNMPINGHRPSAWITRPFGSGMKFVNGDTLLARITPCLENGKTAFVDFLSEGQVGWGSTEYIVLRPKPPLPDYYGYLLARDERLRDFAIGNMTGSSGRQRVPADCFSNFLIVAPPKEIAEVFGKMISGFQTAIKIKDEESSTLAAIRDALLPKLISGEIRVKDAEKFLEGVA